jgi:hypothetical protein
LTHQTELNSHIFKSEIYDVHPHQMQSTTDIF